MLVNVVRALAKRCDILLEKYALVVFEALGKDELPSGQGLNQEITLKCLLRRLYMVDVLEIIKVEGNFKQRFQAKTFLKFMQMFDFLFCLFLMKNILGYANELS